MGMYKCDMDPSVPDESKCAWCCVYCKETDCEYRCHLVNGREKDDDQDLHCEYI